MKILALAFAALGVVALYALERVLFVWVAQDPGICLDPPGPTHSVTRSPEWDRQRAAARWDA